MTQLNFLGLAVVLFVDLLVVAMSTWCVFWLLRRIERFLLRDAADDKPGFYVMLGRLAVVEKRMEDFRQR